MLKYSSQEKNATHLHLCTQMCAHTLHQTLVSQTLGWDLDSLLPLPK